VYGYWRILKLLTFSLALGLLNNKNAEFQNKTAINYTLFNSLALFFFF